MMQRTETPLKSGATWVDICDPSKNDLEQLVLEFSLPEELVQDTVNAKHLPKYELVSDAHWVILRLFDEHCAPTDYSLRDTTRKITLFWKGNILLSIHRSPLSVIEALKKGSSPNTAVSELFLSFFKKTILSFESPLEDIEEELQNLETNAMDEELPKDMLIAFHFMRNRLFTFKRLFWHTISIFQRLELPAEKNLRLKQQDIRETLNQFLFFADELSDDTNNLMNLELGLSTQRTNQVIRILTVFSVFFMPLTFIVGIYGMNFKVMPELDWPLGYLFSWLLMISVSVGIWIWFRRNKWL